MTRFLPYVFGPLIAALLVAGPLVYRSHRHHAVRNLHLVRDGVLYRSGQMTVEGLKRVIHDHGIKTVVSCRDAREPNCAPPDVKEEQYCLNNHIHYHRMPPGQWAAPDGSCPVEGNVRLFRTIMKDPENYPVLVHCFAGIHRTGAYCAIYRMEQEHWSNERAIAEMVDHGYAQLGDHEDVASYLAKYRPSWRQQPSSRESAADCCHPEHH